MATYSRLQPRKNAKLHKRENYIFTIREKLNDPIQYFAKLNMNIRENVKSKITPIKFGNV